ncbi:MAG: bifunctional precorrin-2 dehydrogenase/sirohydrochlorin ferrochelatase, partial [Pseudomonadota bacterium]|nr:bifunctional precorrin-2 dehydrogenase/sirohydrochlorin ferrochelatase [Pseudomonadota bacterium]
MARYFPIFIDLGGSPPLVVGARPALAAKLRLLSGFAPQTDLLTGLQALPHDLDLPGVRHISGMPLDRAPQLFSGRPLVLIDTGDAELDQMLSRRARETGVPVNVPDRPGLCSFYLGSIVDRDPVVLAISTGGFAPVLAQRLRTAIEDWLPRRYGRLALYLNRVRQRIRTLPAARRR